MKELSCEDVLMAQMAMRDREEPPFAKEHLEAHIAGCANCQHELEQVQALDQVFARQTISEQRTDLWPAIENRIAKRSAIGWKPFALIGLAAGHLQTVGNASSASSRHGFQTRAARHCWFVVCSH